MLRYRASGRSTRIAAENAAWAARSTGRCLVLVLAGSMPRKLSPFQFVAGLMGRGTNPPPQFGQTLPRTDSAQAAQNVHSYEQMRASTELGGSAALQCSQVGRSSSIDTPGVRPGGRTPGSRLGGQTQRSDPEVRPKGRTQGSDPEVGPRGQTQGSDPGVRPRGRTQGSDP